MLGPDGRPAAGVRVSVTSSLDNACRHPAAVTTTDSEGKFQLPTIELVHRFFVLLPFEKFTQMYRICGGSDSNSLAAAYDGFMSAYLLGPPDTVSCFSWLWRSATRVTCTSLSQKADLYGRRDFRLVITGGDWSDSATHGSYRIISTHAGPWVVHPQLYVQWMLDSTVVSTQELTQLTTMTALVDPRLTRERGSWSLVVTGFRGGDVERTLIFALGPPDRVQLLTP